jgi:archaellum component FlaC
MNLQNIADILEKIQNRLDNIESHLKLLSDDIRINVRPETAKMSSHIDFIEKVYNAVKSPLQFICSSTSRQKHQLPEPEPIQDNWNDVSK